LSRFFRVDIRLICGTRRIELLRLGEYHGAEGSASWLN
jgi:hypothetical protein